jgi:hypothetical protein
VAFLSPDLPACTCEHAKQDSLGACATKDGHKDRDLRDLGPGMHAVNLAETHHAWESKKGASSHNLINAA